MKTMIIAAGALAAALAGTAVPQTTAAQPSDRSQQCFWPSQAHSFAPVGERAVNVRVGAGAVYHLELAGGCPNIDWTRKVGLVSSGTGRICTGGAPVEVVTTTSLGPLHCAVRQVRKLSPAEIAALPQDARPR